ncbi:MAG: TolC family protein, partial [Halopseudomonas yangmingensis]
TGQYAGQSSTLADLLGNPATSWNLLGGLTQPIFDGSRLRARVEQADARQQELLIDYQRSILTAISEADTALAAALSSRQRVQQQQHVVEQAQLALQLAEARYRAGAIALSTLLDSQRSLFQSQDALLQLQSAQLQTAVDLYRALGGGWQATTLSYSD